MALKRDVQADMDAAAFAHRLQMANEARKREEAWLARYTDPKVRARVAAQRTARARKVGR
jgi:hypothetical protein